MPARIREVYSNIPNILPSNSSFSQVLAVRGAQKYSLLGSQVGQEECLKPHLSKLGKCLLYKIQNWRKEQVKTKGAPQPFLVYHRPLLKILSLGAPMAVNS